MLCRIAVAKRLLLMQCVGFSPWLFQLFFSGLIMYSDVRSHDTVAGVTSAWRPSKFVQEKVHFQSLSQCVRMENIRLKKKNKKKLLKEEKESLPAYRGLIHHIGAPARYRYVGNHSELMKKLVNRFICAENA